MSIQYELKDATTQQYVESVPATITAKPEELFFNPLSNLSGEVNDGRPDGSVITGMTPQKNENIQKYKLNANSTTEPLQIVEA